MKIKNGEILKNGERIGYIHKISIEKGLKPEVEITLYLDNNDCIKYINKDAYGKRNEDKE